MQRCNFCQLRWGTWWEEHVWLERRELVDTVGFIYLLANGSERLKAVETGPCPHHSDLCLQQQLFS